MVAQRTRAPSQESRAIDHTWYVRRYIPGTEYPTTANMIHTRIAVDFTIYTWSPSTAINSITVFRGTIVNRTKYCWVKIWKHIDFCEYRRSYLLWSPIIDATTRAGPTRTGNIVTGVDRTDHTYSRTSNCTGRMYNTCGRMKYIPVCYVSTTYSYYGGP